MVKQKVINHLLNNGGQLKAGETWISIAEEHGIKPPNKKRAKKDEKYRKKNIGRTAQRYWEAYLHQTNKLKVKKQIFVDGKAVKEHDVLTVWNSCKSIEGNVKLRDFEKALITSGMSENKAKQLIAKWENNNAIKMVREGIFTRIQKHYYRPPLINML